MANGDPESGEQPQSKCDWMRVLVLGFTAVLIITLAVLLSAWLTLEYTKTPDDEPVPVNQKLTATNAHVQELYDEYFQWRLEDSPEYATLVGYHGNNSAHLDDVSLEAYERRLNKIKSFLRRAQELEGRVSLPQDVTNLNIFKEDMTSYIDGYSFKGFLHPLGFFTGSLGMSSLFANTPRSTEEQYEAVVARVGEIPRKIDQTIELLKRGVERGITQHRHAMTTTLQQLKTMTELTDDELLLMYMDKFFGPIEERFHDQGSTGVNVTNLILNQVVPAYRKLYRYLSNEYQTRPNIAVTSLPDGQKRYARYIKDNGGDTLSPNEVHTIGLKEVERIKGKITEVIKELGLNSSIPEFYAAVRSDPKNYFATFADMLTKAEELNDKISSTLLKVFNRQPTASLRVKLSPSQSYASYTPLTLDFVKPGYFNLPGANLSMTPIYSLLTLALHEGNPGHHYQYSYALASEKVPQSRAFPFAVNFNIQPSDFPTYNSFKEGWALYAETLGFDMGLFSDPMDRFGHYSFDILRAARLVVDTGIHALGWSRDRAIDYILETTSFARDFAESEVDRYISSPGQALSYKLGQLKISELRSMATKAIGKDNFDIKVFHDVVLDSCGPLHVMYHEVKNWIYERAIQIQGNKIK